MIIEVLPARESRISIADDERTGRPVISLFGDWDMTTLTVLQGALQVAAGKNTMIDLRGVTSLGPAALGELVGFRRSLDRSGNFLTTVVAAGPISRAINRASLYAVLNVCIASPHEAQRPRGLTVPLGA
jgi:anti-anti-sigma regulatory factor